jgi:hypothetical protein
MKENPLSPQAVIKYFDRDEGEIVRDSSSLYLKSENDSTFNNSPRNKSVKPSVHEGRLKTTRRSSNTKGKKTRA